MKILFITLLYSSSVALAQASTKAVVHKQNEQMTQQFRNNQMIQMQMELSKVETELNRKNQEKTELKSQLADMKSPQKMAKTLKLNSKVKQFDKAEAEIQNHLQQLEIDIKDLKQKQASLTENLKN
ncbi:MAG TPA: hypothetical protein VIG33_06890 [Pseudobdellovibrionaceae bacterium]|jgi:hypothetical protein